MVGPVIRIKPPDTVILRPSRPAARPVVHQGDDTDQRTSASPAPDVINEKQHDKPMHYRKDGVQKRVLDKLRRGKIPVEGELNLHGFTAREAESTVTAFIMHCQASDTRCVLIIPGKGTHSSEGQPVLKSKLPAWLQRCPEVLAYCEARREDGGSGAVYVLLKRR